MTGPIKGNLPLNMQCTMPRLSHKVPLGTPSLLFTRHIPMKGPPQRERNVENNSMIEDYGQNVRNFQTLCLMRKDTSGN